MSFLFIAADYPESPGCYLMKDLGGRILYVGKSKSLRSRLRSYFNQNQTNKRLRQLVSEIASIEIVLVNNEAESLLLENNLIKIHKPPFNRALKRDNSGYAYLQLTSDRLPRLDVYYRDRRQKKQIRLPETMQRLGPFKSAAFRDALLSFVTEHYSLRTCKTLPKQVCLQYHIGKCSGVCEGKISEQDYLENTRQAAKLLENGGQGLIERLYAQMELYAEKMEFEKAQHLLFNIRVLERTADKQIVDREAVIDQDVLYFGETHVMLAKVQEGMLRDFQLLALEGTSDAAACDRFLMQRYAGEKPDEIIVNEIADRNKVRSTLNRRGKKQLTITQPKRGLKFELLKLCKNNYDYRMERMKLEPLLKKA